MNHEEILRWGMDCLICASLVQEQSYLRIDNTSTDELVVTLGVFLRVRYFLFFFSPNLRVCFWEHLFSIFSFTNYVAHYPFSLQSLLCTFASTCSSLLQAASFKTTATFCHNLQSKFLNFFNNIQIL